jgi:hypothetical protein
MRAPANCIFAHSPLKNIAVSIMSLKLCLTPKPDDIAIAKGTHSIRIFMHHLINRAPKSSSFILGADKPLCCLLAAAIGARADSLSPK